MPATTSRVAATPLYVNERTPPPPGRTRREWDLERTVSEIDYER